MGLLRAAAGGRYLDLGLLGRGAGAGDFGQRLPGRNLPCRHPVDRPGPARGGAFHLAQLCRQDAVRDPAAGDQAHPAGTWQPARLYAENVVTGVGDRHGRVDPPRQRAGCDRIPAARDLYRSRARISCPDPCGIGGCTLVRNADGCRRQALIRPAGYWSG